MRGWNVTRTTRAANHGGINGPTRAQEEVSGAPATYPKRAARPGGEAAAAAVIRLTRAPIQSWWAYEEAQRRALGPKRTWREQYQQGGTVALWVLFAHRRPRLGLGRLGTKSPRTINTRAM
jgi:hypothetical protein